MSQGTIESQAMAVAWDSETRDSAFQKRARGSGKRAAIPVASLAAIRPHVEHRVSQRLDELLTEDEKAWQEAAHEYDPLLEAAARSLAPGFTTAAIEKRKAIEDARPDMSRKAVEAAAAKKSARKGGKP